MSLENVQAHSSIDKIRFGIEFCLILIGILIPQTTLYQQIVYVVRNEVHYWSTLTFIFCRFSNVHKYASIINSVLYIFIFF